MRTNILIILSVVVGLTITALSFDVEAKKKNDEHTYQESGQPLYFDPDKMKGKGIDDSAPYSDPWYGKEGTYKGGHGSQPGPKGQTEEPTDVKIIEGPKYEVRKKGVRNQEVQKEYETYKDKAEGSAEPEKSHNRWD